MKEIVLTSGILILVIAAARLIFRGKVKQSLIYGMWLLVALRLLIPVQFGSFRFSFLTPAQPLTEAMTEIARNPVSGPSRQEVYQNIEQLYIQQGQPVTSPAIRQEIQLQVEHTITAPTIGQVLTVIWLLGAGLMAIWFIWINLRFQQKLRRGDRALLTVQAPVTVWVTGEVSSPCLVGLLRPVIYLTPASAQNPALDHVLAHELTHYRHKDHLWAFVRCLCLCLYWFHPLVWLAAFLSRRDCELACDEGALAKLGEDERIAYGKTLLKIVSQAGGHGHLLQTATTMNESKRQLKERVNYIVKQPKVWITAAIAMVLVCGVCFGCAVSGISQTEPDTTDPMVSITEPTIPQETTESIYLTEPLETTAPPTEPEPTTSSSDGDLYIDEYTATFLPSEEELIASGFEAWLGTPWTGNIYDFGYIGESSTITVPGGELTIELPEEWIPHLTIVWTFSYPGYWYLSISNTDLLYAVAAYNEGMDVKDIDRATALKYMYQGHFLQIIASDERFPAFSLSSMRRDHCDLGTDGNYVFAAMTMDTQERAMGQCFCQDFIDEIGKETYLELTKGIIITEDMVKEMVTINGQNDTVYSEPILSQTIVQKMVSENVIYCITEEGTVARVDPDGSNGRTLFYGSEELRCMTCDGHMLYFAHGNQVIELNGKSGTYHVLVELENIVDVYHWENGNVYITVEDAGTDIHYVYNLANGELTQH